MGQALRQACPEPAEGLRANGVYPPCPLPERVRDKFGKGGAGFPLAREWALALGRIGGRMPCPWQDTIIRRVIASPSLKEGSLRKDDFSLALGAGSAISGYSLAQRGAVRLLRPSAGRTRKDMGKRGRAGNDMGFEDSTLGLTGLWYFCQDTLRKPLTRGLKGV